MIILLLLLGLGGVDGVLVGVEQEQRPSITVIGGHKIDWTGGGGALFLASGAVRVNKRGIRVLQGRIRRGLGWASAACNASAFAACETAWGKVFPADGPRFGTNALPAQMGALGCTKQDGLSWSGQDGYDISACDIIDEETDIIMSDQILYVRKVPIPTWAYYALIVCAIVLVRGLSNNTKRMLGDQDAAQTDTWTLGASCVSVLLVCSQGLDLYATQHDLFFYVVTVLYCCFYIFYHIWHYISLKRMAPVFNLAGGVLQLISTCFYAGSETPYDIIVICILITRAFVKMLSSGGPNVISALFDAFYLACACYDYNPDSLIAIGGCAYMFARARKNIK